MLVTTFFGTGIFWTALASVVVILSLATLVGRAWTAAFPHCLKAHARFYLSPSLGLASLTIIASLVGRILPLGDSVFAPLLVIAMLVFALLREQHIGQAFRHALIVSAFGIACGASVLAPLFAYGAFNAHNDAFTYLVHGNWLQEHAFGEVMPADQVDPLNTQVLLYQQEGLRMGASFLLALMQALLSLRRSYEVYPAVVVAAIGVCCLAMGFPLIRTLRPMQRPTRLALLALPAFSLGGLIFGANLGFLPQTVGLAFGASLLFAVGSEFRWVATTSTTPLLVGRAALPGAALFSAATFAYSELAPFLLAAVFGSGLIVAVRFRTFGNMSAYGGVLLGLSTLLLNTELLRAYAAIRTQSGVVVGSPVDWTLLGYLAHAVGVHGGAWDGFQWTTPKSAWSLSFALGLFLFSLASGALLAGRRAVWRATIGGVLMPTVAVLSIFVCGILYFRYFVPSPFPKGTGQSWSQFKLSDWSHPFVMALVLLAVAAMRPRLRTFFDSAVVALFAVGIVSAVIIGASRVTPLMQYYGGVRDLNGFYLEFRKTVLSACPSSAPIYLALRGEHHKFRQMAVLHLPDRKVVSDWTDDGYIFARLPVERRTQQLTAGSCVVEPIGQDGWLSRGTVVGSFRVGVFDGHGRIRIASVTGAYDRESDGSNWWHWVERKVSFKLQPFLVPKDALQAKLRFEYATRGKQTLTVRVVQRNGASQMVLVQSKGDALERFEKLIDVPANELAEISVETDGIASPLGSADHRVAAWVVRNVTVSLVSR
jgi:hypothetical protein